MDTAKQYRIKPKLAIGPTAISRIKKEVDRMTGRRATHGRIMAVKEACVYHYTDSEAEEALHECFPKYEKLRRMARDHEQAGGDCYLVEVNYGPHPGDSISSHPNVRVHSYLLLATRPDNGQLKVLAESNYESLTRGTRTPGIVEAAKSRKKKVREDLRTYRPIILGTKPKVRESWLPFPTAVKELVPGANGIAKNTPTSHQCVHILLATPTMYDDGDGVPIQVAAATVVAWDTDTMRYASHHTLLSSLEYEAIQDKIWEMSGPKPELPQAGRPAVQIIVTLSFPQEPVADQVRDALHDIADRSRNCLYDQTGTFQPCESQAVPTPSVITAAACIAVTRPGVDEVLEAPRTKRE